MIEISEQWRDEIFRAGEKAFPNECCGVLLGTIFFDADAANQIEADDRRVEGLIPIDNSRESAEQYHRFKIEPEDLMKAEKAARSQKREILGFYHSHPNHPAKPSQYDLDHAFPFYSYVIVSIENGKADAIASWRLTDDRKEFLEERIGTELQITN